jgi:hypothetical protein
MADPAAMNDPRQARPKRDVSVSGDAAAYYVEEHESGWRVIYNDAPMGIFKDAGDASRFACDLARIQAQIGRVTWVVVLAQVEEVHRFETRAASIKPPIDHEAGRPFGNDRGVKEAGRRASSVFLREGLAAKPAPNAGTSWYEASGSDGGAWTS